MPWNCAVLFHIIYGNKKNQNENHQSCNCHYIKWTFSNSSNLSLYIFFVYLPCTKITLALYRQRGHISLNMVAIACLALKEIYCFWMCFEFANKTSHNEAVKLTVPVIWFSCCSMGHHGFWQNFYFSIINKLVFIYYFTVIFLINKKRNCNTDISE